MYRLFLARGMSLEQDVCHPYGALHGPYFYITFGLFSTDKSWLTPSTFANRITSTLPTSATRHFLMFVDPWWSPDECIEKLAPLYGLETLALTAKSAASLCTALAEDPFTHSLSGAECLPTLRSLILFNIDGHSESHSWVPYVALPEALARRKAHGAALNHISVCRQEGSARDGWSQVYRRVKSLVRRLTIR